MAKSSIINKSGASLSRHVIWLQGVYYLAFGLWPLFSMATFVAATGPKTDVWLVKTVGLLLVIPGLVLILAAYRRQIDLPIVTLGIGVALVLISIELVYVFSKVISPIYLVDTIFQILFIIGWLRRRTVSITHSLNRKPQASASESYKKPVTEERATRRHPEQEPDYSVRDERKYEQPAGGQR